MMNRKSLCALALGVLVFSFVFVSTDCAQAQFKIKLSPIGTYKTGIFDEGGAEIVRL